MLISPTQFDLWGATLLARLLGHHPLFDMSVEGAIHHNILGGIWYGAALFVFWVRAARLNQQGIRLRLLTTLTASAIAILLTLIAGELLAWTPPIRHPDLAAWYPPYMEANPNSNCFPSQSTALYATVAAGISSFHRTTGLLLWIAVGLMVALPRMYVGGHYFTDVAAGIVLALVAYAIALFLLEKRVISYVSSVHERGGSIQVLMELAVFAWILQVAVEFQDAAWILRGVKLLFGHAT